MPPWTADWGTPVYETEVLFSESINCKLSLRKSLFPWERGIIIQHEYNSRHRTALPPASPSLKNSDQQTLVWERYKAISYPAYNKWWWCCDAYFMDMEPRLEEVKSSHISRVARSFVCLASKHMCLTTHSASLQQAQRHGTPGCRGPGESGDCLGMAGSADSLGKEWPILALCSSCAHNLTRIKCF